MNYIETTLDKTRNNPAVTPDSPAFFIYFLYAGRTFTPDIYPGLSDVTGRDSRVMPVLWPFFRLVSSLPVRFPYCSDQEVQAICIIRFICFELKYIARLCLHGCAGQSSCILD